MDVYSWVLIPLMIFCARIADQTLGTLRFIFISRGHRLWAPLVGFFEVTIWLISVREVLVNLRNVACILAYGLGFAAGNFIGLWVEEKLSMGMVMVRMIIRQEQLEMANFLKENNYGYTMVEGEGARDKVNILFTIIKRKNLPPILQALGEFAPDAFYTVENIKSAREGIYPLNDPSGFGKFLRRIRLSK